MLERFGQFSPAAKEGHTDNGRDGCDGPEDRGHDLDDVAAHLFVTVDLFRRRPTFAVVILVLDLAAVAFEALPADARDAGVVIGPAAHAAIEAPVDAQVRFLTVPSGTMFRANAFAGQRVLVVRRGVALTDASVVARQVVARVQLSDRNLEAAGQSKVC